MMKFNQYETIKKIDKYFEGKNFTDTTLKKKPFFNFYKLWYYDPFMKYLKKHPEFLDTKDIKIINN